MTVTVFSASTHWLEVSEGGFTPPGDVFTVSRYSVWYAAVDVVSTVIGVDPPGLEVTYWIPAPPPIGVTNFHSTRAPSTTSSSFGRSNVCSALSLKSERLVTLTWPVTPDGSPLASNFSLRRSGTQALSPFDQYVETVMPFSSRRSRVSGAEPMLSQMSAASPSLRKSPLKLNVELSTQPPRLIGSVSASTISWLISSVSLSTSIAPPRVAHFSGMTAYGYDFHSTLNGGRSSLGPSTVSAIDWR